MGRVRLRAVVVLCSAAVVTATCPAWAHPLEVVPFDDPAYTDLYRLAADGVAPLWAMTLRPLTRLELARMVSQSLDRLVTDRAAFHHSSLLTLEQLVLRFSDELALLGYRVVEPPQGPSAQSVTGWGMQLQRVWVGRVESGVPPWFEAAAYHTETGSYLRLETSGTAGLGPLLAAGARLRHVLSPPPVAIDIDRLYLSGGQESWVVQAGQDRLWWGPAMRGSFLLSDNAGPLQTLRLSLDGDRVRTAKLFGVVSGPTERYLYGTRVDWLATDTLRLGIGETVVASGAVYLPYLVPIPFSLYSFELWVRNQQMGIQDNYNVAFDFDWRLWRGTTAYGELYVNQLSTNASPFPSIGGMTAGLYFVDPLQISQSDLRLEFTGATNWIYATAGGANNYVWNGKALGQWCAPDCELWSAELSHRVDPGAVLTLGYDLVHKGPGRLGQTWSGPANAWANLYLSGVVETTQAWRLKYAWTPDPALSHELGVGWSSVVNVANVAGQARQGWFAWWTLRYQF